jgi:RHS repeat-associated protein
MRLWTRAFAIGVGLLVASPLFAQASPSNYTTGYRYDAARRLTGTISPDADGVSPFSYLAVRNTYDPTTGELTKVEKGTLSSWPSQSVAPASWTGFSVLSTLVTDYDSMGRKVKETLTGADGTKTVTQYNYDALGRPLCTAIRTDPAQWNGQTDACIAQTTGPNGPDQVTKNIYDAAGEVVQVRKGVGTPEGGAEVTYTYTPNGKKDLVIDGDGNKAEFTYDGLDRVSKWTFASKTAPAAYDDSTPASALASAGALNASDFEAYAYDNNGNRTSLTKRDGSVISYTYNALDRMTVKTVPSRADLTAAQTRDVYYGYDADGHQLYARFDSVAPGSDGVTSTYNGFGELASSTLKMGTFSKALTSSYDADGNRTSLVHPENSSTYTFTYAYDGLDRLNALCTGTGTCTNTSSTLLDWFTFNNAGLLSNRSEGSTGASAVTYGWDNAGRLTSQSDNFVSGSGNVAWTLGYTPASQIQTDTRNNSSYAFATSQVGTVNRDYTTNGLNQYSKTSTAGTTTASFTYDNNANLKSDGTWTYIYDIENRLVSASSGTGGKAVTVNLTYDPLGRLFQTDEGTTGTTTKFVYDGDALALEYNGNATPSVINRYVHGSNAAADDPLVWYSGATLGAGHFLHADHLGSIAAIASADGHNFAINTYDEYGINGTTNNANERFGYTGQAFIPELGLYYYKARFYSATLGRFLQTDPIGYDGGISLYGYVGDDPTNGSDPTGMDPIGDTVQTGSSACSNGGSSADGCPGSQSGKTLQVSASVGGFAVVGVSLDVNLRVDFQNAEIGGDITLRPGLGFGGDISTSATSIDSGPAHGTNVSGSYEGTVAGEASAHLGPVAGDASVNRSFGGKSLSSDKGKTNIPSGTVEIKHSGGVTPHLGLGLAARGTIGVNLKAQGNLSLRGVATAIEGGFRWVTDLF